MWFLRRMLRISWTSHTTNEDIMLKADRRRKLQTTIWLKQLQFFGHVMRKEEMEELFVTGRIEGKRDRGRQWLTYVSSMEKWTSQPALDLIRSVEDRKM